jgi:hypothetical protein
LGRLPAMAVRNIDVAPGCRVAPTGRRAAFATVGP